MAENFKNVLTPKFTPTYRLNVYSLVEKEKLCIWIVSFNILSSQKMQPEISRSPFKTSVQLRLK